MTQPKGRVGMRLAYDGESTRGIKIVQQLLDREPADVRDRSDLESALETLEAFDLPPVLEEMVLGGERLAEQIHSQPTKALQEMIQNAQDQHANKIRFSLRKRKSVHELLIAHDGDPVVLDDVLPMRYALLSGSRSSADKIGRFGIGLKTLNQFGDKLEVHCPCTMPGFEFEDGHIRRVNDAQEIQGLWNPKARETLFILQLKDMRFDWKYLKDWIENWDPSSLLFLSSLRSVSVIDLQKGKPSLEKAVSVIRENPVELSFPRAHGAIRQEIHAKGSRQRWSLYRVNYPVPREMKRVNKAIGKTVELAVSIARTKNESRFFAGLPLDESSELTFSCCAPFDINVDRTSLLETKLNEWLLARIADLVVAAAEDCFTNHPKEAWSWIPLSSETAGKPEVWLRQQSEEVFDRVASRVTSRARVNVNGLDVKLSDLLVEADPLDSLFDPDELERLDIERLQSWQGDRAAKHPLPRRYRDRHRWREVLDEVDGTRSLGIKDALSALSWSDEEIVKHGEDWLIKFISAALDEELDSEILAQPCLLVEGQKERQTPQNLVASGQLLIESSQSNGFGAVLGSIRTLSATFRSQTADAKKVREWLKKSGVLHHAASDHLVLKALAEGSGKNPMDLSNNSDSVTQLRDILGKLSSSEQEQLGKGIGKNILLKGYEHGNNGRRVITTVAPCKAYIPLMIEKVQGWSYAASSTPGISWIDGSYAKLLRGKSETPKSSRHLGALTFLRHLGAATSPRIHPGLPPNADPHAALPRNRLTKYQIEELEAYPEATTLLDDRDSHDLESVLADLVKVRKVTERRKRSQALFKCLQRGWSQNYAGNDHASAARHYYSWNRYGQISTTWIGRLASEPWLSTRERKFTPKAPRELAVLTDASFKIEEDPSCYAYELEAKDANSPVVEAIGLSGKPSVETIIQRVEDFREQEDNGSKIEQKSIDRCYRALATYCSGGIYETEDDFTKTQWRAWFGTMAGKPGLIRYRGRWLSIPDVRRGGCIGDRVPWVGAPEKLWEHLDVPETDVLDCRRIFEELARENAKDDRTEIYALRRLVKLSGKPGLKKKLSGIPIRIYEGWATEGVYAVQNRKLAEALGAQLPVWKLPISFNEAKPLVDLLQITPLEQNAFDLEPAGDFDAYSEIQEQIPTITARLKYSLHLKNASLLESISANRWKALTNAKIVTGNHWMVKVRINRRRTLSITPQFQIFHSPHTTLCVRDEEDVGNSDAGGLEIARFLLADNADPKDLNFVALSWECACRSRDSVNEDYFYDSSIEEDDSDEEKTPDSLVRGSVTKSRIRVRMQKKPARPKDIPRHLNNPNEIKEVPAQVISKGRTGKRLFSPPQASLQPPKISTKTNRTRTSPAVGDKHYSDTDREDLGYLIAEAYLKDDAYGLSLEDIRDQPNVGADAVDRKKDVWVELKTAGRDRPNFVHLEPSQAKRAKEKRDQFLLVIVWNLEKPRSPELLIIDDPLTQLDIFYSKGIKLGLPSKGD